MRNILRAFCLLLCLADLPRQFSSAVFYLEAD